MVCAYPAICTDFPSKRRIIFPAWSCNLIWVLFMTTVNTLNSTTGITVKKYKYKMIVGIACTPQDVLFRGNSTAFCRSFPLRCDQICKKTRRSYAFARYKPGQTNKISLIRKLLFWRRNSEKKSHILSYIYIYKNNPIHPIYIFWYLDFSGISAMLLTEEVQDKVEKKP